MPGANAPAAKNTRKTRHGHTGNTRHSPRNGFTAYFALPGDRALLPPSPAGPYRKLDTSVEMSGPHDLAVRIGIARLARQPRPPHPAPTSVTFAKRPSEWDGMREVLEMICPTGKAEFCPSCRFVAPSAPTGSCNTVIMQHEDTKRDIFEDPGSS
jgi:hypothetical protein